MRRVRGPAHVSSSCSPAPSQRLSSPRRGGGMPGRGIVPLLLDFQLPIRPTLDPHSHFEHRLLHCSPVFRKQEALCQTGLVYGSVTCWQGSWRKQRAVRKVWSSRPQVWPTYSSPGKGSPLPFLTLASVTRALISGQLRCGHFPLGRR